MTSGTQQQREIEQAFEHFGLGAPKVKEEKAFIIARVDRLSIKTMFVSPICPRTDAISKDRPRELMRRDCNTDYYNHDLALISVPQSYVLHFWLVDYVLDKCELERYLEKVAKFNPPMRI